MCNGSSIELFLVICLLLALFVYLVCVCVHVCVHVCVCVCELKQCSTILCWQNDSGHKSFKDSGSVTFNTVFKVISGINI